MKILLILVITANMVQAQNNKVLFVMSAADTLELNKGQKLRQTGVFLNEFYLAYKFVTAAGYSVDIATPGGIAPTIDEESVDDKYWKDNLTIKNEALEFIKTDSLFNHPKTLEMVAGNKSGYIGLIIPGGQGLMIDLKDDINIPILLKYFAEEQKPTGLICHAPSLILTIPKDENPYIGFKVNAVSPLEEFVIERFIMKGKPKTRKIAKKLKKLGLNYRKGLPKANFAVRDRNLITSQNPYSGEAFNKLYLKSLAEYLEKATK